MAYRAGRHFLQIPGPTNVPERILRAMDRPTIDHRGPTFAALGLEVLAGLQRLFRTEGPVFIFPSSATGAWEAAIVNTLRPGDRVLMVETGQFAVQWRAVAERFGLDVQWLAGDWRHGVDPAPVQAALAADADRRIRAVMVVHNETSTGIRSDIAAIRAAIDAAGHPALYMVDCVSSLGAMDYRHDAWRVDVAVSGSQKGLMLPPGLGFNAVSERAFGIAATAGAGMPRSYWDWRVMRELNRRGVFPYTPATNLLYGLREALAMLQEEGPAAVFARHARLAAATRSAVRAWGLELCPLVEQEHSAALTAVLLPDGHDADALRQLILDRFDLSLGAGLGKFAGRLFRIGHLGDLNDLTLLATLTGVEMGLRLAKVPHRPGGVTAAMAYLADWPPESITRLQ